MNEAPFALEVDSVSFSYPDGFEALTEVDFRVRRGEFVAMLASNGSGKTTLIKVLTGILKPRNGKTRVNGRNSNDYPQGELYQQVGLVFQNPNDQLFSATVREDVAFGPRNLGLPEAEVEKRVTEALHAVGASELEARAIHHLSFGQQKRVAIAGVLAMKPPILILDEPTAGLDPLGEHNMLRLLGALNREQGITIVLATHSVDTLPLFADRIYLLNQGRVLKHGTPEEVFLDYELIERASLRLPYVTHLLHEMKRFDGVPIQGMPLTVREARDQLLKLIPDELIEEVRIR
jgi:cobalt/nickel transport system ATP-binding protein